MFLLGFRIQLTTKWTVTDPSSSHVSVSGIAASVYPQTYRCARLHVPEDKEGQQGKNLRSIEDRPLALLGKRSSYTNAVSAYPQLSVEHILLCAACATDLRPLRSKEQELDLSGIVCLARDLAEGMK